MSAACRHCMPDDPPASALGLRRDDASIPWHPGSGHGNALAGMTYRSALAFGAVRVLAERLDGIERGVGIVNGVTTWCPNCRACSVLSYSSYLHSMRISGSREPPMARLDYYAHMCDLAERMTGRAGLGFSVSAPPLACPASLHDARPPPPLASPASLRDHQAVAEI